MTPSTTNTAARELPRVADFRRSLEAANAALLEANAIGGPARERAADEACRRVVNHFADWIGEKLESVALTQQQGGEQEAGDGLPVLPYPGLYAQFVGYYTADQMRAYATAALRSKQPAASEGDGKAFDRGVRAAQDVVRALCCHYQEEMKYPDCSIGYLSDLEEVTQGLFWEIDKLLDKTCRVPPKGWHCTRGKDHEGPCAAVRNEEVVPTGASGSSFWIEEKALEVAQEISQMNSPHRAQLVAGIHLAVTKAMLWAVGGTKE